MKKKIIFSLLVVLVFAIGLLHFITPGELVFFHDTFRRLSYFPIVIGAIWFGFWGGFVLAVLASIAFIPHLLLFIGQSPETYLSELTEIILYIAAGLVTGIIAGRAAALREKYRLLSEKLERSYTRLHEEAELLIEVEEQLSASQKFSALGRMAATIAHEVKNPLSSIKGTAEIFLDEFPQGHPKREFAKILVKEVSRLNATVESVLQYSRGRPGSAGKKESLARVIMQVTRLLDVHIRKKSISLAVSGMEKCDDFFVVEANLSQVFLNLLLNAIDAIPKGGAVELTAEREAEGVTVTVRDHGPGIPIHLQNKLFQPFVSGKEEGTGLGLSISRKIVESNGGKITHFSPPDGGAAFSVFLPSDTDINSPVLEGEILGGENVSTRATGEDGHMD